MAEACNPPTAQSKPRARVPWWPGSSRPARASQKGRAAQVWLAGAATQAHAQLEQQPWLLGWMIHHSRWFTPDTPCTHTFMAHWGDHNGLLASMY